MSLAAIAPQLLAFLGLLVLVVLRLAAGREAMASVWLAWGNLRYWLLFGLAFVAYYVVQAVLNAYFGLGQANLAPIPAPPGLSPETFLIVGAVQSVLLAPILSGASRKSGMGIAVGLPEMRAGGLSHGAQGAAPDGRGADGVATTRPIPDAAGAGRRTRADSVGGPPRRAGPDGRPAAGPRGRRGAQVGAALQ